MNKGTSTLLSTSNVLRTASVRVLRVPRSLHSHPCIIPRLRQNTNPVHDLAILRHSSGPAPLGGDRYNYIQSEDRHNVQSTT